VMGRRELTVKNGDVHWPTGGTGKNVQTNRQQRGTSRHVLSKLNG
jgi:hypothetical protein